MYFLQLTKNPNFVYNYEDAILLVPQMCSALCCLIQLMESSHTSTTSLLHLTTSPQQHTAAMSAMDCLTPALLESVAILGNGVE